MNDATPVLKTTELQASGGSNPPPSATFHIRKLVQPLNLTPIKPWNTLTATVKATGGGLVLYRASLTCLTHNLSISA